MTRASRINTVLLLALIGLGLVPASLHSQQATPPDEQLSDPEVNVVLEGRQRSRFRMAMPAVDSEGPLGPQVRSAAEALEDTLRADASTRVGSSMFKGLSNSRR